MKKCFLIGIIWASFLIPSASFAALTVTGLDSRGGQLVYDTDLNITWYDYADQGSSALDLQSAAGWAASLSVTANGKTYTDWRLPITVVGSGNINLGEMGHLYYDELKNIGGVRIQNHGPFTTLLAGYEGYCWTSLPSAFYSDGTPYAHYRFSFGTGNQASYSDYQTFRAFAVHDGYVGSPVPVPASALLFGTGLFGLVGVRRKSKK